MRLPDLSCSFPHLPLPLFDADDSRTLITQFTGRETSASVFYPCFHFGRKSFFKPSVRPTANSICQCKVSFSFLPYLPEAAERVLLDQMWLGQVPLPPFSITQRRLCSEARALAALVQLRTGFGTSQLLRRLPCSSLLSRPALGENLRQSHSYPPPPPALDRVLATLGP